MESLDRRKQRVRASLDGHTRCNSAFVQRCSRKDGQIRGTSRWHEGLAQER
jgi:hypothetical protein